MSDVSYQRLDKALRSLGFSYSGVKEMNRVYLHKETGALVVYPEFPPDELVLPRHLQTVRAILNAYGIADPTDFEAKLQRAG
jgi:hypothetical protein